MKTFYLAVPILGCNVGEANNWRIHVADKLKDFNIRGVSPLRCEPIIGEVYSAEYPDPRFGVPRAIAAKNRFDVENCDMTLAVLPKPPEGRTQSFGTIIEIGWADRAGKQIILVTDDPSVIRHPVIDAACDWKFFPGMDDNHKTMEDCFQSAIDVLDGVLGGYIPGRRNV